MFEYITENITQGRLYELAGKTDDVCTLTLQKGTKSYEKYGSKVTVVFIYTQKERRQLEADVTSLDDVPNIKAKGLVFLDEKRKMIVDEIKTDGIPVKDIVSALAIHYTPKNNTFNNSEKRSMKKLEIPFKPYGGGKDIGWIYGFLCRLKKGGVGLMPDDEDLFTAYQFILDRNQMTHDERQKVIDKEGKVVMSNVGYH